MKISKQLICNGFDSSVAYPRAKCQRAFLYQPEQEWTYSHHQSLTYFKGRYHAIWSNGLADEDAPKQRVLWSHSGDFANWSKPLPLIDSQPGRETPLVITAAGFHVHQGTLVAYFGHYEYSPEHMEGSNRKMGDKGHRHTGLKAISSTDGLNWSEPVDMNLPLVPNHPPEATASGRLMFSGNISFPISDDPFGLSGWKMRGIYPGESAAGVVDDSESFWHIRQRAGWPVPLCEGSFYQTDDGIIHMLLRSN
ncbi:MAG: exo-alpha-sialidase, partial [Planctomycetes bacterium]|nr:exo-alpha-sialidase [Planctomycetota bacterium]